LVPDKVDAQVGGKWPLVGYLAGGKQAVVSDLVSAFQAGMRELGYSEGHNIDIVYRFAEGQEERLPSLAAKLVGLKPAVILAGAVNAAVTTKNVSATIAIVSPALADAVHLGLIASEAQPGGNVTGITPYIAGLLTKQMELAREVVPGASKVGLLGNMNGPKAPPQREELEAVGRKLGIRTFTPEIRGPAEVDSAIQTLASDGVDAVIVLQTSMTLSERRSIAVLAAANRLPMIYGYREHVADGGLISYGVDLRWCFCHAATFVDKILEGTAPGDLPLEFP